MMKNLLKHTLTIAITSIGLLFGFVQTTNAQVSQCTDGGCTPFQLECEAENGVAMCLNYNSAFAPTPVDEHRCNVAYAIMEKNCNKDNPQPCLVAEDRVLDRCYYLPLTACVTAEDATDLFQNHTDACFGTCDDVQGCNIDLP